MFVGEVLGGLHTGEALGIDHSCVEVALAHVPDVAGADSHLPGRSCQDLLTAREAAQVELRHCVVDGTYLRRRVHRLQPLQGDVERLLLAGSEMQVDHIATVRGAAASIGGPRACVRRLRSVP